MPASCRSAFGLEVCSSWSFLRSVSSLQRHISFPHSQNAAAQVSTSAVGLENWGSDIWRRGVAAAVGWLMESRPGLSRLGELGRQLESTSTLDLLKGLGQERSSYQESPELTMCRSMSACLAKTAACITSTLRALQDDDRLGRGSGKTTVVGNCVVERRGRVLYPLPAAQQAARARSRLETLRPFSWREKVTL